MELPDFFLCMFVINGVWHRSYTPSRYHRIANKKKPSVRFLLSDVLANEVPIVPPNIRAVSAALGYPPGRDNKTPLLKTPHA